MGYYDFPHTHHYDGDLGFVIREFKKMVDYTKEVKDQLSNLNENIIEVANNVITQALKDGKITLNVTYSPDTQNISFVFKEVE